MQTGLGSGVAGQAGANGTQAAPALQRGQGTAPAAPAGVLSDDEILGLDFSVKPRRSAADEGAAEAAQGPQQSATAELQEMLTEIAEPAELQEVFAANPALRQAWRAEKAYREVFPTVETAREVGKLFPTVEDARAASAQVADLAQLDRWFFSGQPESHAEMAAAIYRMNPAAFRSLARAMEDVLGQGELKHVPQSARPDTQHRGAENAQAAPLQSENLADSAQNDKARDSAAGDAGAQGQFASFYQETNAVVVEGVVDAIQSQVQRLLPEGVAAGAQKRVIGEIYRELDASLRGNRALAQQVRQAFRSGAMDPDHQAAIVSMVLARAKQALPGRCEKSDR